MAKIRNEVFTDDNPYLEDAVDCPHCKRQPVEVIGECTPIILCGIPLSTWYGTYLWCPNCGNRTQTHREIWRAYLEWNERFGAGNG